MSVFETEGLLKIAIQIEERGAYFYQEAMDVADQPSAKKLFQYLSSEEKIHAQTLQALEASLAERVPVELFTPEYLEYLNALGEKVLFPSHPTRQDFEFLNVTFSAIRFAIQKELDSIYFYKEIKNLIPLAQQAIVDKIISEEQKHFLQLIKLEKSLR